ncbi:MAG: cell filamentation protein Fic [Bacteroidetes bacterium]|nr:MAG: cell filamentation protein Fic [Bacteroidota bacterium]
MDNQKSEIILYQTESGQTKLEVRLENETVWLSQKQMTELFQRERSVITKHINNVFKEKELHEESNVQFLHIAHSDKPVKFYSLDVIISVGYRVKSHRGTQFRIWATQRLKEFIIKGFTLDDERLKEAGNINYFDELLERIRDIRSSEKIFYQKVKDIYTLSIDYDPKTDITKKFFTTVQNKLHWAVHQHTAAEIVAERINAEKQNLGLTAWKGEKIRKSDISIAKNYLNEAELSQLNLLVEQYLAFAENQARQKKTMYMQDWIKKLNDILIINDNQILEHAGKISRKLANEIANKEYDKYSKHRQLTEDKQALDQLKFEIKKLKQKD